MPAPESGGLPRQIPLEFGHRPGLGRDDLVVSPANAAAVAMVERWPDWPAPVTVLAGPPGSGKSHLAHLWRGRAGARDVAGDFEAAAREVEQEARPILVDGIGETAIDERGLFHLFNAVRGAGATMLLTSRRFPAAWPLRLPDLRSRLKAATLVEIGEPDDALLAGVIAKLFADRQVEVERHVVAYLVARIERSLATAIDVVERIDRKAMEEKARITRGFAAGVISAMDEGQAEFGF